MVKLTKSMPIVKERTCTASMVLDTRTNRKNVNEFPLAIRFTIDRKLFYYQVGGSYTEKKFSEICNASKSASDNYRIQKEWRDTFAIKYKDLLENLNKGGILTYEMVRQAVVEGNTYTVQTSNNIEKALSFIGIWEQTIQELRTNDNGARFTTAESYEYSLKSFKKILGDETIKGFDVSAAEIQKWKDGMHDGVVGKGRCLMPLKIEDTWAKLHHQELEKPVSTPTKNTQQPKIMTMTIPKPMPTADNTPKIRHFDFYTDEFHHYPVDIAQNCLDIIDKNIALDADNVFAKIGDVQKTAILLFAEYIDAATTIAAQSGGGGGGVTSGWGRDKDENELSWAYRCAMMANRLCRPRKKQGYGR